DGPAIDGRERCYQIARGARGGGDQATLVAGQGIDQAALADVGRPRHNQPPGRGQMTADAGVANKGFQKPRTFSRITAFPGSKDIVERSTERSVNLIQQDAGGAYRDGVSQSSESC